jgi:hypothetical protein
MEVLLVFVEPGRTLSPKLVVYVFIAAKEAAWIPYVRQPIRELS